MFRNRKKFRISIVKLYFCFSFLVIIFTAITAFWISAQSYSKNLIKKDAKLEYELTKLSYRLKEKLGTTEYLLSLFVQRIRDSDDFSPENIKWLIRDDPQNYKNNVVAWTFLNYIDKDLILRAVSNPDYPITKVIEYGIKRPKIASSLKNDMRTVFDKRSTGVVSRADILPMAMKLTDNSGNIHGLLSVGIDLDKLNSSIRAVVSGFVSFIMLDEDMDFISSPGLSNASLLENDQVKRKLKQLYNSGLLEENSNNKSHIVKLPVSFNVDGYVYSHITKLDDYPFYLIVGEERDFYYNKYRQEVIPEIFRNILVGAIFAGLLIFLSYIVIKPIMDLSEDAEKISKSRKINEKREYLTQEFNLLAKQFGRIQDMASKLITKEKEAKETNKKLKAANSLIRSNISFMTHELKNPNASILGFASLIDDKGMNKVSEESLQMIKEAANYQNSQIQYFLDLFEFQVSGRKLKKEFVDVKYLVNWSVAMLKNMADERKIKIHTKIDDNLPFFLCDGIMFGQMLQNLISNSIKYNNEYGNIHITVEMKQSNMASKGCMLQIMVEDDGIGISKEDQKIIFAKFKRIDLSSSKLGHGIGLAYVKKCIIAHCGEIKLKSALGKGAKFTLEFAL